MKETKLIGSERSRGVVVPRVAGERRVFQGNMGPQI